jgi:DNA polymerase III delta prime subunit
MLAKIDRAQGLNEISFVAAYRPFQRLAAQKALLTMAAQDLQQVDSVERMAGASEILKFIPSNAEYMPEGLNEARDRIGKISTLAHDYLTRVTPVGRVKAIEEMRRELESFRDAMVFVKRPVGPSFQPIASRWLEIVKVVEAECRRQIAAAPLLNPFIAGNPLMARDNELFKGRRDIIVAIEERIINTGQRPALLLYGRRRIGKTSTLLNLPRLLGSEYAPVYIQCQEAKWQGSDEMFCYHLAGEIFRALKDARLSDGLERPQREKFEKYAFTELSGYLDEVEELSRRVGKRILLGFDEYEKLEEGIARGKISTTILNEIRSIVQHRERFAVLFSGSHRFDELKTVSWADYLINAQTIELSFLEPEDARKLIERPTADFNLEYEPGVVEEILEITHCQPYLVQAIGFDLVNYLNSQQRLAATADDLNVAIEKTLVSASGYFYYTWAEECSEDEREVLLAIAMNEAINPAEHRDSLRRLCQKEILERRGDQYRFTIELFRRWILKDQLAFEGGERLQELVYQA